MPNTHTDTPSGALVAPVASKSADTEFENILRDQPAIHKNALTAALRARPGDRYTAALDVLLAVYKQPESLALSAASFACVLVGASDRQDLTTDERLLLDMYRALPGREQERVWNFAQDATQRAGDAHAEECHAAIEYLWMYAHDAEEGVTVDQLERQLNLTPTQRERYAAAWNELRLLHREQEEKREAMRQQMKGEGATNV